MLSAPLSTLVRGIRDVAAVEAPLHFTDLAARLVGMWGVSRVGSRIHARIVEAVQVAEVQGAIDRRGQFVWLGSGECRVRSRAETRIPADRIAPEEYREAVLMVLRAAGRLPREELVAEVRALFGFNRLGPLLEEAIGAALDSLLAAGIVGEGGSGITFRGE